MVTSILRSQNFRFQIAIYLKGYGEFLAYIHFHVCTVLGCNYFFFKNKNILETN
jgi:hypothetical protein